MADSGPAMPNGGEERWWVVVGQLAQSNSGCRMLCLQMRGGKE